MTDEQAAVPAGSALTEDAFRRAIDAVPDGRGRMLVIAIIRDLTYRHEADRAMEHAAAALTLLDERDRIARDLHDTVIQHLFAVGLSLQAAASGAGSGLVAERVQQAVDGIDRTIREIRSTIFALQSRRPGGTSLRDEITAVAHQAADALGFEPTIAFDGAIDSAATDAMRDQLVATLREALSNVARHAHATSVNVDVVLKRDNLMLYVCDDGIGMIGSTRRGNGVPNMHARAVALGGRCLTSSPTAGGTVVDWWVPIGEERL